MKYLPFLALLFSSGVAFSVQPHAYVTDQLGGAVHVIDTSNDTVQIIFGFDHPRVVKVTADGTRAFIGCDDNTIRIIDTITNRVLPEVIQVNHPVAMALTPQHIYIASTDNTVSVINTLDYSPVIEIAGFNNPQDVKVRPDGKVIYVTNSGNGTISIIDAPTHTIVGTITGFQTPIGLTFTVEGNYAYIADTSHNAIYVLRTADNHIVDIILGFSGPSYIAVTPDETYAFVSNIDNDMISVLRVSDHKIVHKLSIPNPKSLAVTQDGEFLYVGGGVETVFKVRISDYAIVAAIPNFKNPSNITFTTNNTPANTLNACQELLAPRGITNHITWQVATGQPVAYTIYRDLDLTHLIVRLPPTSLSYEDANLEPGQTYTYFLLAEYADGFSSTMGNVEVSSARICQDL
ncbi:MAG: hypothetical protein KBC64_05490 [Simkaniaceae bacterium]|nr:hypothetical protein [Simkaniaceae bacterium]